MADKLQYKEKTNEELKKTLSDLNNEILNWLDDPDFDWWRKLAKTYARQALDTSDLKFDPETHKLTEDSKTEKQADLNNFCIMLNMSKSDFENYLAWLCKKYHCSKFELAQKESQGKLKKDDGPNYKMCKTIIKWIDHEVEMIKKFSLDACTELSYKQIFANYGKEIEDFFVDITPQELLDMNDVFSE